jgi:hypothetical protein
VIFEKKSENFIFKKIDFFQKKPEKYSLEPLTPFWRDRKYLFLRGDTVGGLQGVPHGMILHQF